MEFVLERVRGQLGRAALHDARVGKFFAEVGGEIRVSFERDEVGVVLLALENVVREDARARPDLQNARGVVHVRFFHDHAREVTGRGRDGAGGVGGEEGFLEKSHTNGGRSAVAVTACTKRRFGGKSKCPRHSRQDSIKKSLRARNVAASLSGHEISP